MKWQEAISEIESPQFNASLNATIGTNAFFKAICKDGTVQSAFSQLRKSGDLQEEVLGRLYELSELDIDREYANPNDTVLAVLLWLSCFAFSDHSLVQIAARYVDRAPQCWYAKKLAARILNPPPIKGGNESAMAMAYGSRLHWGPARFEGGNESAMVDGGRSHWRPAQNVSMHSAIPAPNRLKVKLRATIGAKSPHFGATGSYRSKESGSGRRVSVCYSLQSGL